MSSPQPAMPAPRVLAGTTSATAAHTPTPLAAGERLTAFEWLRAGAGLGVVLLHACVPYLTHPMQFLAWPVQDRASSLVNGLFWTIELLIMPVFLVIAGFFAVRSLAGRSRIAFLKHRAARLLLPLAVVGAVILPLDLYSWLLGWVVEGQIDFRKMQSLKFAAGMDDHLWGLSHLWFLQYLFLYCAVYAGCHALWPASLHSLSARYLLRRTTLLGLLAAGAITLTIAPEVVFGFQHDFLPFASKWIYHGTFFAGGIWLAIYDTSLRKTRRLGRRMLLLGAMSATASLVAGMRYLEGSSDPGLRLLLGCSTTIAAWALTMGLVGLALRYATTTNRVISYLAAASFWIYLVHHPLVGLIHTDLKILLPDAWPLAKALTAMALTTLWCLASFEVLVRRTALGRLLGVRQPPRMPKVAESESKNQPVTMPIRRAA
ncbi:acyltransferase family protein [Roseimaritima ulvae]|uniref:Glucans biosynthesis protein n=1 Tax=Roseimaritima ulvae TaxID=980254 RepID=A0A5B9QIJ6_9BACT|nr:acyltransferase [Roseimaritima ulvae]QEG38838.1 glucans biosynthesis protein [Roseimaritima ulvae]